MRPLLFSALVLFAAISYRLLQHPPHLSNIFAFPGSFPSHDIHIHDDDDYNNNSNYYPSDVVNLTRKLVSFGMREPYDYISAWLSARTNLSVSVHALPSNANGPRANVLALSPGAKLSDVRVLLFTHMDVVPVVPGGPPFDLSGVDGFLYGRGTTDARGILSAMMVAMARMHNMSKRVALLAVTGEETVHDGIRAVADWDFSEDLILLNGEPTEGRIATSQKGILKFDVISKGTAAHSGYPSLGNSAIVPLVKFLGDMHATDWNAGKDINNNVDVDAGNTMNIGVISGGSAANVVPADARAVVAFRCVDHPETLLRRVRDVMRKYPEYTGVLELRDIKTSIPMKFYAPPKSVALLGTYEANYNTDIPSFPRKYKHAVLFGGGTIHVAHTADERAEISTLEKMPQQYEYITRELLGEG